MKTTILFSLPRSRTQWWAHFFGGYHDRLAHHQSPASFVEEVKEKPGFYAETAGLLFHDQIVKALPDAQRMYVFRHPEDVLLSIYRQTHQDHSVHINSMQRKLMRHAYEEDRSHRQFYGMFDLQRAWDFVIGEGPAPLHLDSVIVDVPLRQQYVDARSATLLFRHREP